MRRKNRKWVALAVGIYLLIIWSAYRWGARQRIPEGNILVRIAHEAGLKQAQKQAEERERAAKEKEQPPPPSTAEARLAAAGPAYVAARYDASHVVFMVANDTETRFSSSSLHRTSGTPTRVAAPTTPTAPLAGLQELYEPDSESLHFFPILVQQTQLGDRWSLSLSAETAIPVVINRVVIAPLGCSIAIGFLAAVPTDQHALFAASSREYFLVRHDAVTPVDPQVASHIGEIAEWKTSSAMMKQIEQQLNARMKDEVAKIDARLFANEGSPGATAANAPVGDARPLLKKWLHADQALARGEGALDYDVRAFRLTPDGLPRLYVRARWRLAGATLFIMTAWFKVELPDALPSLLSADSSWSTELREGEAPVSLGDRLDFQSILNEFDADHDGWAELLVFSNDGHPVSGSAHPGPSITIAPYLYTDQGLVAMKTPLRRDMQPPESCLDP
jgi:hypothetical protein